MSNVPLPRDKRFGSGVHQAPFLLFTCNSWSVTSQCAGPPPVSRHRTCAPPAHPISVPRPARVQHDLDDRAAPCANGCHWQTGWARCQPGPALARTGRPSGPAASGRPGRGGNAHPAAGEKPLPDEQAPAALWWRTSSHLSPAAITATGRSGASATIQEPGTVPGMTRPGSLNRPPAHHFRRLAHP